MAKTFSDLPTPEQMQLVIRIYYFDEPGGGTMMMTPHQNHEENFNAIRWGMGDNKTIIGPISVMTDAVIPIMQLVTGYKFVKTEKQDNKTTWEREDCLADHHKPNRN